MYFGYRYKPQITQFWQPYSRSGAPTSVVLGSISPRLDLEWIARQDLDPSINEAIGLKLCGGGETAMHISQHMNGQTKMRKSNWNVVYSPFRHFYG